MGRVGAATDGGLEGKIDGIAREVGEIRVLVAGMMPRAEVDGELARRVSIDAYASDQGQVKDRLTKLENSPQRLLAWVSAGVGCFGVAMSAVAIIVGIVEYVVMHH